ncbi:hypothetical protein Tco_0707936 [Tanacetum coccineum]
MPTEMELTLEQTQQGVSYEVSVLSDIEDSHGPSDAMHKPLPATQSRKDFVSKLTEIHSFLLTFSLRVDPHGFEGNLKKVAKMTTTVVNNLVFRGFFEKQKLTGPNFIDWYRQLCIVLSAEDKLDYPNFPISTAPVPAVAGQQVPPETLAAHAAWARKQKEIDVLMIMTMEPDLQRNLENLGAYYMLKELKTLFSKQAE